MEESMIDPILKPRKKPPHQRKTKLVSKRCLELHANVIAFDVNYAKNLITIETYETPTLSVYQWLSTINKFRESQKSSAFSDFEQDALYVVFVNPQDEVIGKLKLTRLKLIEHSFPQGAYETHYAHKFTIQFDTVSDLELKEEEGVVTLDDEWKTIHI